MAKSSLTARSARPIAEPQVFSRMLTRRAFMAGAAASGLAGCVTTPGVAPSTTVRPAVAPQHAAMYGPMPDEKFPVPAADISGIHPKYYRTRVDYRTDETPGTIVVDVDNYYLYLTQEGGKAIRYGVGLGREGFAWNGKADILMKRRWPTWTPPAEMIEREPYLAKYRNGMAPGLENPLGARALYLFENGRDTLYRLHGTNQEWSIGKAVSSGCVRLLNQDAIDLHARVPVGTKVVVKPASGPVPRPGLRRTADA